MYPQTITPRSGIAKPIDNDCIEPHSGICCFDTFIDCVDTQRSETLKIAETQLILNGFLGKCREGVGGIEADRGRSVDMGGSVGTGGGHVGKSVGVGG